MNGSNVQIPRKGLRDFRQTTNIGRLPTRCETDQIPCCVPSNFRFLRFAWGKGEKYLAAVHRTTKVDLFRLAGVASLSILHASADIDCGKQNKPHASRTSSVIDKVQK